MSGTYPSWTSTTQNVSNDIPGRTDIANAADYNEHNTELTAHQTALLSQASSISDLENYSWAWTRSGTTVTPKYSGDTFDVSTATFVSFYPTASGHVTNKQYVDDQNLWNRAGTTLSPNTAGDNITTIGTINCSEYKIGEVTFLQHITTENILLGTYLGGAFSGATNNVLIGTRAGETISSGDENTCVGDRAGRNVTTGSKNTLVGMYAGRYFATGHDNTCLGYRAGNYNGSASAVSNVVAIGSKAGYVVTGNDNVLIGTLAGYVLTTGTRNVLIGWNAGASLIAGASNVFIGYNAGGTENGSDKLYIHNSNTTTPLIYGDFSVPSLTINGSLDLVDNNFTTTGTGKFDGGLGVNVVPDATYGLNVSLNGTTRGVNYSNTLSADNTTGYGAYNTLSLGSGAILNHRIVYGTYNDITVDVDPDEDVIGAGYGLYNVFVVDSGDYPVYAYGVYTDITATGSNFLRGTYFKVASTGANSSIRGSSYDLVGEGTIMGLYIQTTTTGPLVTGIDGDIYASGAGTSGFAINYTVNAHADGVQDIRGVSLGMRYKSVGDTAYGTYIYDQVDTLNNPTEFQVGHYIIWSTAGTDVNNKRWALYNASTNTTAGKIFLGLDDTKTYWGTGFTTTAYDNGTDFLLERSSGSINFGSTPIITSGIIDWSGATHSKPKIYSQSTEPNIANDSYAFWTDTDNGKYYLVLDIGGAQKKIELI